MSNETIFRSDNFFIQNVVLGQPGFHIINPYSDTFKNSTLQHFYEANKIFYVKSERHLHKPINYFWRNITNKGINVTFHVFANFVYGRSYGGQTKTFVVKQDCGIFSKIRKVKTKTLTKAILEKRF